jgi:hypothetical protein
MVAYDSFSVVKEKRKKSEHQYDAILCRISKVDLSLGEGESFVLKVNGIGLGETAEYLQTGRGETDTNKKNEDSKDRFKDSDINQFEGQDKLGKVLFAQFYNMLPTQKRTKITRKLHETHPIVNDPANYINIDRDIREMVKKGIDSGKNFIGQDNQELEVPEGADLQKVFPDQKFVRFEILDLVLNSMKQSRDGSEEIRCPNICKSKNLKININNTIIRAFPYMFSTDSSKCIIVNTKTPNLGIEKFFNKANQENDKSIIKFDKLDENVVNTHPPSKGGYPADTREGKNGGELDAPFAFPCTYDLTEEWNPIREIDDTFIPYQAKAYNWGWLKDIYINLDFFNSVITKPNYTMKDIYYELLNGISSAFGGLHDFQIRESVPPTGVKSASNNSGNCQRNSDSISDTFNPTPIVTLGTSNTPIPLKSESDSTKKKELNEVQVVDLGFTGTVDVSEPDENREPKLVVRGVDSPFLSFDLSVDVPSSLATSAIMENRGGTDSNTDQNNPRYLKGTFFSNFEDQVGTELLRRLEPVTGSEEDEESEDRNPALEYLNGNATVLPFINNRGKNYDMTSGFFDWIKANDTSINEIVSTYAFKDIQLFNHLKYGAENEFIIGDFLDSEEVGRTNLPLGLTTVSFEIHGLGGFKVGDRLFFEGLPKKFTDGFIYYVTKVSHSVTDTEWKTSIEAKSKVYRQNVE